MCVSVFEEAPTSSRGIGDYRLEGRAFETPACSNSHHMLWVTRQMQSGRICHLHSHLGLDLMYNAA